MLKKNETTVNETLVTFICVHGSYTNNVVTCLQWRIQRGRWGRPPL